MAKNTITSKKTLQRSYKNKQQKNIKIAIAGIGNCSSALVQGLFYYKNINSNDNLVPGLMHNVLGNYKISDIKPVAAFDVDKRKVGKDLSEAIFALPNCTKTFCKNIPKIGVKVKMGPILDGVADHMKNYPEEKTFVVAKEKPVDVVKELKKSGAEILINYMPVGSQKLLNFTQRLLLMRVAPLLIVCQFLLLLTKTGQKNSKKDYPQLVMI